MDEYEIQYKQDLLKHLDTVLSGLYNAQKLEGTDIYAELKIEGLIKVTEDLYNAVYDGHDKVKPQQKLKK